MSICWDGVITVRVANRLVYFVMRGCSESNPEHHQIVVAESDLRCRRRHRVYQGRIKHPRLTGSFEISLHTSPLVPNKETIGPNEEESEDNKDDGSNFSCLDQIMSNVVNNGGVELITE